MKQNELTPHICHSNWPSVFVRNSWLYLYHIKSFLPCDNEMENQSIFDVLSLWMFCQNCAELKVANYNVWKLIEA